MSAHFLCQSSADPRALPSSPTRRSSDLLVLGGQLLGQLLRCAIVTDAASGQSRIGHGAAGTAGGALHPDFTAALRSEEHTSELQSRGHLVCRLLLENEKRLCTTCCSPTR